MYNRHTLHACTSTGAIQWQCKADSHAGRCAALACFYDSAAAKHVALGHHDKFMLYFPNESSDRELTHPVGCCYMLACLHNDKIDEANILDDPIAKVPAKGLSNLDTIAQPEVWELTWLHCRQHEP